jgi:peptidoglycan-associated lipoprotein
MVKSHLFSGESFMRSALISSLLLATLLLAGCPKRDAVKDAPSGSEDAANSEGVNNGGLEEGQSVGDVDAQQMQGALAERVIYFDYDRSEIRSEYNGMLAAHARNLAAKPTLRIRLEGHSDERGSREYNIGLGERRAQTVRRALMLQGVADDQIATVSYGEERPAVSGSDETSWGKNRRVEIVYAN